MAVAALGQVDHPAALAPLERVLEAEAADHAHAVGRDERHEGDHRRLLERGGGRAGRDGGEDLDARLLRLRPRDEAALDVGGRVEVLLLDRAVRLVAQVDQLLERVGRHAEHLLGHSQLEVDVVGHRDERREVVADGGEADLLRLLQPLRPLLRLGAEVGAGEEVDVERRAHGRLVGLLHPAQETEEGSAVGLGRHALHGAARPPRREGGRAVGDEGRELPLEAGRRREGVGAQLGLVVRRVHKLGHLRQLLRDGQLLRLEAVLVQLVVQDGVVKAIGRVLLGLFLQLPVGGDLLVEAAQKAHAGGRAAVLATDGGGGGQREEGARPDATEGARVVLPGLQRGLEGGHDLLQLGVEKDVVVDGLAVAEQAGALQASVVERLPDGAGAAAVGAAEEEDLERALEDPAEEDGSASAATVQQRDAREGEPLAAVDVDAEVGDLKRHACRHTREQQHAQVG